MVRTALLLLLILALGHQAAMCQDMMFKKNGDSLAAKVLRVMPYTVEYNASGSADTLTDIISTADLNYIVYKNGVTDSFHHPATGSLTGSHIYKGNFYVGMRLEDKGKEDALRYYTKYKGVKRFTGLSVFFFPYNIIPTIAIVSTRPKEKNLGYPYPELMLHDEYRLAYEKQAFKIKKKKAWGGYLLGTGIYVGVITVITASLFVIVNHH